MPVIATIVLCILKVYPEAARCALAVRARHLEVLGGSQVILALADVKLEDIVKEKIGRRLLELQDTWPEGVDITRARLPEDLTNNEIWWKVSRFSHNKDT